MDHVRNDGRFIVRKEDADILVVEKAAGLLTVPTPKGDEVSLVDLLRRYLINEDGLGFAYAAHRLDRPVSGLLLFVKSREMLDAVIPQFAEHTAERRYIAAVDGLIKEDEGTFETFIGENTGSLRVYATTERHGRKAITHWKVRQRFESSNTTLVDIRLETGLRNQIRLQFAEAGHPLLGEKKYLPEGRRERSSTQGKQRIFLHAAELTFKHPRTEEEVTLSSVLPPQLERWVSRLRRSAPPPSKKKRKDRHRNRKNVGKPKPKVKVKE